MTPLFFSSHSFHFIKISAFILLVFSLQSCQKEEIDFIPETADALHTINSMSIEGNDVQSALEGGGEGQVTAQISLRVFLDGCYDSSIGLMKNVLGMSGLPSAPDGTPIGLAGAGTGDDAVVDWVLVQLRSATNNATVVDQRYCLVQRDGDVVDENGLFNITMSASGDMSYFVSINHRNHLGCMTDEAIALSNIVPVMVDFTDPNTTTFTTIPAPFPRKDNNGVMALWMGDANTSSSINYQGTNNDPFAIYTLVITYPGNTNPPLPNYIVQGYHNEDVNMDGKVIYQGPNSDKSALFFKTIMVHPNNQNNYSNFVVYEALP